MHEDVFEKIITRELPAEILYEDADTLAFLDIAPNNPGHTLVISKTHADNVLDAPEAVWLSVMRTVHLLAPVLLTATGAKGININSNHGSVAGQVVPHLHVHLIPRHEGDGLTLWHGTPYEPGTAEPLAASIRELLRERI